jgi:hypothetical protein
MIVWQSGVPAPCVSLHSHSQDIRIPFPQLPFFHPKCAFNNQAHRTVAFAVGALPTTTVPAVLGYYLLYLVVLRFL